MFAVFLGGATSLLPVFAKDILRSGPNGLGLLQAALPVGSVACALYLAHRPPMQKAGRALLWCVVVFGLATILFGLVNEYALGRWLGFMPPASVWLWLALGALFMCGAADNVSVIVRHTSVQLLTPDGQAWPRLGREQPIHRHLEQSWRRLRVPFIAYIFGPAIHNTNATSANVPPSSAATS